jgi:hypothetical protein
LNAPELAKKLAAQVWPNLQIKLVLEHGVKAERMSFPRQIEEGVIFHRSVIKTSIPAHPGRLSVITDGKLYNTTKA